MTKTIRKSILCLLTLTLMATLLFTGCDALIDNGMHRTECEAYLNAMLAGDFEAAHAITPAINEDQHRAYFEENCKIIEGATSYTLTQTGWKSNYSDGVGTQIAAYQINTDNGLICMIALQTTDGVEGISYLNFWNVTDFAESVKSVDTLNIVLSIVSLAVIAFNVWMLVDCIKRKMNRKVWMVILTLLTFNLAFVSGNGGFHTSFGVDLFWAFTSLKASIPDETVTLKIVIPLGALLYFFQRKQLTAQYEKSQKENTPDSIAPLTVTDYTKPEEPSAEDNTPNE